MVEAFKSAVASYLKDVLQLLRVGVGDGMTRSWAEALAAVWGFTR